ncbi:hypothetical protein [Prosthecobacter sp.]|jgi:hypothetical protein|uniref:hypothetical protein n=1 Tax=Prosthecobacter sp. TaxID=1965333 RepID=UPI0037C5546E
MAIKLSANYSKKLGLPHYSSHSFSASVEVELTDITQVEAEVQKLYQLLQHSVDQEIQHAGFIPDSNGHSSGRAQPQPNGNGRSYPVQQNGRSSNGPNGHLQPRAAGDAWNCTDGQRGFILRIVSDNKIEKSEVEDLSQQLFGTGVKQLNKMQASQLIDDLLVKVGKPATRQTRWQPPPTQAQAA